MFQGFKDAREGEIPQLLSDHPNDQNRINVLERHFREDPETFKRFNPDGASATPFTVPKNAPEVFMN